MTSVSMVELRRDAEGVLQRVSRGERLVLTYRGRPVARLEPFTKPATSPNDPIYRLAELAVDKGEPLSNAEMDAIVYGR